MTTPTTATAPTAPASGTAPPTASTPPAGTVPAAAGQRDCDQRLGLAVRAARRAAGLTLVQLAALAGLSHPFLSQIENGRSRPSMRSLFQIAEALGTTQQALMAAGAPLLDTTADTPVDAAADAPAGTPAGTAAGTAGVGPPVGLGGGGGARLLLHDASGVDVTEFLSPPPGFGAFFRHDRHELLYVVSGRLELQTRTTDADGRPGPVRSALLGPRATAGYGGDTEHRWRRVGEEPTVVLVVHTPPSDPAPPAPGGAERAAVDGGRHRG